MVVEWKVRACLKWLIYIPYKDIFKQREAVKKSVRKLRAKKKKEKEK